MKLKNKILAFAITSLLFLFNLAKAVFANGSFSEYSGEINPSTGLGGNDDPQTITTNVANILLGFSFIILLLAHLYRIGLALIKKIRKKSAQFFIYYSFDTRPFLRMIIIGLLSIPLFFLIFFGDQDNFFIQLITIPLIISPFFFVIGLVFFTQKSLLKLLAKKTNKKPDQIPAYYLLLDLIILVIVFYWLYFFTGLLIDLCFSPGFFLEK